MSSSPHERGDMREKVPGIAVHTSLRISRAATTPNLPIFVAKSNVTGTARLH
jgi:hypothetical protein